MPDRSELVWAYHEFSDSLPVESVAKWRAAVEAWEQDNNSPNPFVLTLKSMSFQV